MSLLLAACTLLVYAVVTKIATSGNAMKASAKSKRRQRQKATVKNEQAKAEQAILLATDETKEIKKEAKRVKQDFNLHKQLAREVSWHHSVALEGLRMSADVWIVLSVPGCVASKLVDEVRQEMCELPTSAFKPMGGQSDKFFEQMRRQHQFSFKDASKPVMRLYLLMLSQFALVGYSCRAVFGITGGAHQFMHQDRGHYHSVSVFVCISRRQVRFGQFGGPDIFVWMNPGDVLMFNGLVWHSGLQNDSDSCVIFMYFDLEPFFVTAEMMAADPTADGSRFGFTKMLSEEAWQVFSSESEPKELHIQTLQDIRAAPSAILQALIYPNQWNLEK